MAKFNPKFSKDDNSKKQPTDHRRKIRRGTKSASPKASQTERDSQDTRDLTHKFDCNNPEWYKRFAELVKDATSVSFAYPTGTNVPIGMADYDQTSGTTFTSATAATGRAVSGVCILDTQAFMPAGFDAQAPINVAGTNTFLFLRRGKSGNAPYDAADITQLLYATSHLYSAINWAQRVYGLAQVYSAQNKYLPKSVLQMENLDVGNIVRHLGDLRYGINQIIHKAASLTLPSQKRVPLYSRQAFLFSNVYVESPSIKDQLYAFHPLAFYKYTMAQDPLTLDYYPCLKLQPVAPSTPWTVDDILNYLDDLMEFIYGDTDVATMMADISNAYGDDVIKLSLLDEGYMIIPTFDQYVLDQIHNAEMPGIETYDVNNFTTTVSSNVTDNSYVLSQPCLKLPSSAGEFYVDRITNMSEPSSGVKGVGQTLLLASTPSPDMDWVLDATRLMPTYQDAPATAPGDILIKSGGEIVFQARIGRLAFSYDIASIALEQIAYATINGAGWTHGAGVLSGVDRYIAYSAALCACKYAPKAFMNIMATSPAADSDVYPVPMFSFDNYGILMPNSLEHLNNACLFGLLSLPLDNIL